jgi:uncharacterized metal-binding protein YceD (DUF177 family)
MSPLVVNLRHLAAHELRLEGAVPPKDLGLNDLDSMVKVVGEVAYELEAQKLEGNLLVQGRLTAQLECTCVRCLKSFVRQIDLEGFTVDLPLEGEDATVEGDFVDLTPSVREDILLAFPQHPLCESGCVGLEKLPAPGTEAQPGQESQTTSPVWAALNKLKL